MKFITVSCACGATFKREVKRGRPQVWCPGCVSTPFTQRVAKSAAPAAVEAVEVEVAPDRIVNENDPLDAVRAEIEAGMVEINLNHKARFAALLAEGGPFTDPMDIAVRVQAETFAATTELYGQYRKTKVMMPVEHE